MIEMMVVMGIIATLLGILIVALAGAARTAQTTNTRALMNSMKQALVQFRTDIGYLPPILGDPFPTDFTPENHDLRKLFDPRGPDLDWQTDTDNVLPEQIGGSSNSFYDANVQEWFSWTSPAEYLLGYGHHQQDGYGDHVTVNWPKERPPMGIRDPGPDGVWGATAGTSFASLDSRMGGTSSNIDRGKVYGPYLELKDENLLASISTGNPLDGDGRLRLSFPGEVGYDADNPKVIVDYWGHPIRYYRRLYSPGSLASAYRPFGVAADGTPTRPPTLSDMVVLRPFEIKAGTAIDGLFDFSQASYAPQGDPSTTAVLNSAEFALFSSGPDGRLNQTIRYDNPDDPGNTAGTSFFNEDNIVELGP